MKTATDTIYPSVSVVMSVWSGDEVAQISAAIRSILNQTIAPKEFIVVVDGPVNCAIQNCLELHSRHRMLTVHYCVRNVGRGEARNYAINKATGEIIMLMDADDLSRPDRLEKQFYHMNLHNLDILGGFIEEFDIIPGDLGKRRTVPINQTNIVRMARLRTPFNHVSSMYRKSFFNKVGGYRSLNFVEDWDFYLRAIHQGGRFENLPVVLVDVRRSIARRRGSSYFEEEKKVLAEAFLRKQLSAPMYFFAISIRLLKATIPEVLFLFLYRFILRR